MLQKEVIESETRGDNNKHLNGLMSEDVIQKAVEKLTLNKSAEIDTIPNEILKSARIRVELHELLPLCLQAGLAPLVWRYRPYTKRCLQVFICATKL